MVVLLLFGLIAAGCGDDADAGEGTTTTEATTTTEDPVEAEEAVIAAYEAHWEAYIAASDPPDPEAEALLEHTAGEALAQLQQAIRGFQAEGVGARGHYEHNARVVHVGTATATVEDCFADHTELYLLSSDAVVDSGDGAGIDFRVELSLEDGTWKVTNMETDPQLCPRETDG